MKTFYIKPLKHIVFLGAAPNIIDISDTIQRLNLDYSFITSPSQLHLYPKGMNPEVFDKIDDSFIEFIKSSYNIKETLFVSLAARWIFNKKIYHSLMDKQLVNFHGTRLPLDSGGGGFSWRIMRGDRIDNQLVHLIDDGVDTGDIIYSKTSVIPENCITPKEIENYHRDQFILFFYDFCNKVKQGNNFTVESQPRYLSSYMPRLSTLNNGYIDWSNSSDQLIRFINAFDDHYPGSITFINNKLVHLKSVQRHGGEISGHPYMRGLVIRNESDWIVVRTSDEFCFIIERVLNEEDKNIVSSIKVGDRFHTPNNLIEKSITHRARFGPNTKELY